MIMRQFAAAVSKYDVYIAPYIDMRAGAGGAGRGGRGRQGGWVGGAAADPPPSAIRDHFQVANLCGYPAVSVPNGFTAEGQADEHHLSRPAVRGSGDARARARVSGARGISPQTSEADMTTRKGARRLGAQSPGAKGPHGLALRSPSPACSTALSSQSAPASSRRSTRCSRNGRSSTPGCAVGVATDGKPVLAKGYGMADLEHDVRDHARLDLRGRLGLEAVHRRGGACCSRATASCRSTIRCASTSPSCPTTERP